MQHRTSHRWNANNKCKTSLGCNRPERRLRALAAVLQSVCWLQCGLMNRLLFCVTVLQVDYVSVIAEPWHLFLFLSFVVCRSNKSPWVCLTCSSVHCGRWVSSVGVKHVQSGFLLAWLRQFKRFLNAFVPWRKPSLALCNAVYLSSMLLCYLLRVQRMYPAQLLSKRDLSAGCDRSAQSLVGS